MEQETRKSLSDDYEIKEILGRGGFSVVRKGTEKGGEKQVAIKTLRRFIPLIPSKPSNSSKPIIPTAKQMLISDALLTNELLVMRRIVEDVSPHPNVIHLHDVCEDNGGVHLILELCLGGELFDRIVSHTRYNEVEAAALKIMDFGLSSVEDSTDPVVGLFGSIDYVSPEALSRGKITPKSDIWSLGVILYILQPSQS